MEDYKRIKISGKAVPVRGNDIDTDRIIPARYLRCVTFEGLGEHAFEDDRKQTKEAGKIHPLDNPKFQNGELLFANKNFGCGSSREHAPQSIMRWGKGIKAIVGESFAEIFFGNCVALGVPCVSIDEKDAGKIMEVAENAPDTEFTVDLENLTISFGEEYLPITLEEGRRKQFIEGKWDSTAELFASGELIQNTAENLPYFNHWQ